MQHFIRRSASLMTLLALAACASAKPVETAINPTPPEPVDAVQGDVSAVAETGPGSDFAGIWYVSGVFPTSMTQASVADPHLGTALTIAANEVSDINGQRCISPTFNSDQIDATATGLKAAVAGNWNRLVVRCEGKDFAVYLRLPDQPGANAALLQQRREGLYLLEQAGAVMHRLPSEVVPPPQMDAAATSAHGMTAPAHEDSSAQSHNAGAPVELTPTMPPAPVPEGPVADSQSEPVAKVSIPEGAKASAIGNGDSSRQLQRRKCRQARLEDTAR
ncbi:MAG: hypothetical protein IPK59_20665 [Rhodospirillaceae bacterium]|nr:hypothetical protein [Rhodospirillaceae bacterium]